MATTGCRGARHHLRLPVQRPAHRPGRERSGKKFSRTAQPPMLWWCRSAVADVSSIATWIKVFALDARDGASAADDRAWLHRSMPRSSPRTSSRRSWWHGRRARGRHGRSTSVVRSSTGGSTSANSRSLRRLPRWSTIITVWSRGCRCSACGSRTLRRYEPRYSGCRRQLWCQRRCNVARGDVGDGQPLGQRQPDPGCGHAEHEGRGPVAPRPTPVDLVDLEEFGHERRKGRERPGTRHATDEL